MITPAKIIAARLKNMTSEDMLTAFGNINPIINGPVKGASRLVITITRIAVGRLNPIMPQIHAVDAMGGATAYHVADGNNAASTPPSIQPPINNSGMMIRINPAINICHKISIGVNMVRNNAGKSIRINVTV